MATAVASRVDVEALRRTYPLADLVEASGIPLKPSGEGRLKGLCPFHADRRPSLVVYLGDQHFHCFACGAHGDVVDFVRRRFGLDFTAACQWLQGLTPMPRVHAHSDAGGDEARRWDRLSLEEQVVMNTAAALYHHALWRSPHARAYLHARSIPDRVIRACALGYADGHSLEAFLRRHSGLRIAQGLGLLRRAGPDDDGRPLREFLAGRLVVPEIRGGQCLWFIGRALDDGDHVPKYLALPGERPILGLARVSGQREALLAEGVFDWLTAVSWELSAFSPCGTHLAADRLGFLARAQVVFGAFDADAAGQAASERLGVLLGERWAPIALPDGCDLNDLAQQRNGRETFFRLLAEARRTRKEVSHAV